MDDENEEPVLQEKRSSCTEASLWLNPLRTQRCQCFSLCACMFSLLLVGRQRSTTEYRTTTVGNHKKVPTGHETEAWRDYFLAKPIGLLLMCDFSMPQKRWNCSYGSP
ncbi:hypothetical protein HJG60_011267 [Phyllostomus discolor]|uniref:Uncharacterized protein n=1 Tax=Phyllostomus discolor TaxID=89673 RepID=A0A834A2E7_9CHIR|nr:hypothetical protein HJG60_011267 [Phyllostomus discolor]